MREMNLLPLWPVLAKSKKRRLVLAMALRRNIPYPRLTGYKHSLAAADAKEMPFFPRRLVKAALGNSETSTSATRDLLDELEKLEEQLKTGRANAA
jgi:hypothetical protein